MKALLHFVLGMKPTLTETLSFILYADLLVLLPFTYFTLRSFKTYISYSVPICLDTGHSYIHSMVNISISEQRAHFLMFVVA